MNFSLTTWCNRLCTYDKRGGIACHPWVALQVKPWPRGEVGPSLIHHLQQRNHNWRLAVSKNSVRGYVRMRVTARRSKNCQCGFLPSSAYQAELLAGSRWIVHNCFCHKLLNINQTCQANQLLYLYNRAIPESKHTNMCRCVSNLMRNSQDDLSDHLRPRLALTGCSCM